ncbi:MAG: GTPase Era, partial [Cetobacterium sp.]
GEFDAIVEIAGQYAIGIPKLLDALDPFLEAGIKYYPDDMYTDMPTYRIITEVVREKILERTRDEIPHSVAIEIINVTRRNNGKDKFDINIYVERDSQKGIIIGKQGSMLKEIGVEARKDIENLIGVQIYLELWVKVKDDWRKKKPFLKELGYVEER